MKATRLSTGSLTLLFLCLAINAQAQPAPAESTMEQRIDQVLRILEADPGCEAVAAAVDLAPEVLYGGLRVLPTKGELLKQTTEVDRMMRRAEMRFAQALGNYALQGKCTAQRGRALDTKLFVEYNSEMGQAVGRITANVGDGDSLAKAPGDDLERILDESTGEERKLGAANQIIRPGYSVKLRSPAVPPWILVPEEDIRMTEPIPPQHCVVIFKEFKGLMVRLHFERIIVVTDPWVGVFGFPRGTKVPIWRLEWVFSEYVKEWNICNADGQIKKTVTQRVKQDRPLNFFWRFYRKDP
jgi:hypothetical protein